MELSHSWKRLAKPTRECFPSLMRPIVHAYLSWIRVEGNLGMALEGLAMADVGARRRADWRLVLLAWLVTLQIADIVTTKVALALSGNWEMNPAMAWSMANLGTLGWVSPKVALVALAIFALRRMPRWPLAFAVSFYAMIVANNLYAIALMSGTSA